MTDPALAGRRALVTGAAGFVGAHVVRALLDAGAEVVALVRPGSGAARLDGVADRVRLVRADVRSLDDPELTDEIGALDAVLHLAAAGVDMMALPDDVMRAVNVDATGAALRQAKQSGARRFVHAASCFSYGDGSRLQESAPLRPGTPYAATKAEGERLAFALGAELGLEVVSLRPFTVYGPLEDARRLVPHVVSRALAGGEIELTGGRQTRDFVYAGDAAAAFVRAAVAPGVAGEAFNVCTGVETSVRDLVLSAVALAGGGATPRFGARPYRDAELWSLSGDPSHASERLGWTAAVPLEEGLRRTIAHARTGKL